MLLQAMQTATQDAHSEMRFGSERIAGIQEKVLGIIWNLGVDPDHKIEIASAGAISSILESIHSFSAHTGVQEQGVGVIMVLALHRENRSKIAEEGGVHTVVEAMHANSAHTGERWAR